MSHPRPHAKIQFPSNAVLIGSPICPFVARARIVAEEKGFELQVRFIDLFDKPAWFLSRSPTGTVPALEWGEHFIFESSVISEFLDELTPECLHPDTPLARAVNRSWIEFAASTLRHQYMLLVAQSDEDAVRHRGNLLGAFKRLESIISMKPFFNGAQFSIVDCAYAPVFVRCSYMLDRHAINLLQEFPRLQSWASAVMARPSVCKVHDHEYSKLLTEHLAQRGSVFA